MNKTVVTILLLFTFNFSFSQTIINGDFGKKGETTKQKVFIALVNTTIKYLEFLDTKDTLKVLEAKKFNQFATTEFKKLKEQDFSNEKDYNICKMSFKLFDDFDYKHFLWQENGVSKTELEVSGKTFYITGENAGFLSQLVIGQKIYKELYNETPNNR